MTEVFSHGLLKATLDQIRAVAANSLSVVLHALGSEGDGRTGGFLRIFLAMDSKEGPCGWNEVFAEMVGEVKDQQKAAKYEILSVEKAIRLMKRHAIEGHISSWQSWNEKEWEYGGAFILEVFIPEFSCIVKILVTFSGLPPKGDEAHGLVVLKDLKWSKRGDGREILLASKNHFAAELLDIDPL
ncbi:MAG TPA: hypothetical protein VJC13_01000 [Candidatus Paceibacterota bacterium]|nr:hypothetical protein [uncultured archaeon]